MPKLRLLLSLTFLFYSSFIVTGQDVILYEHHIELKKTKKFPKGHLHINLPQSDSCQTFDFYEFSIEPDTIIKHRDGNVIATWNSQKLLDQKFINIQSIGFLSYYPSNIQKLNNGPIAIRLPRNNIPVFDKITQDSTQKWISLGKKQGSQWIEITRNGAPPKPIKRVDPFHLFKLCNHCEAEVNFVSPSKFKLKYSSTVKTKFHWNDLYTAGKIAYENYQLKKALLLFNESILINPQPFENYVYRGITCARLGQFDQALKSLQHAMRSIQNIKPAKQNIRVKASVIYAYSNFFALQNKKELALKSLRKSIELDPSFSYDIISNDVDFINIREYPPFQKLLEDLRSTKK